MGSTGQRGRGPWKCMVGGTVPFRIQSRVISSSRAPAAPWACPTMLLDELIATLNEKIAGGSVRDRADQLVQQTLDQGLITEDGARLYPVRGGIPTLIADNAIELNQT